MYRSGTVRSFTTNSESARVPFSSPGASAAASFPCNTTPGASSMRIPSAIFLASSGTVTATGSRAIRRHRVFARPPSSSFASATYSAHDTTAVTASVPAGNSTDIPIDAGSRFFCFGSGSAPAVSSSCSSDPARSSSSSVGSSGSRPPRGTRNPVRYQRDGGSRRTSSSAYGPTRSPASASTSPSLRSSPIPRLYRTLADAVFRRDRAGRERC